MNQFNQGMKKTRFEETYKWLYHRYIQSNSCIV